VFFFPKNGGGGGAGAGGRRERRKLAASTRAISPYSICTRAPEDLSLSLALLKIYEKLGQK